MSDVQWFYAQLLTSYHSLQELYVTIACTGLNHISSHVRLKSLIETRFSALPVYEYLITFGQEYNTVWNRKMSASSILLLSIRWEMLAFAVAEIVPSTQKVSHFGMGTLNHTDQTPLLRGVLGCSSGGILSTLTLQKLQVRNYRYRYLAGRTICPSCMYVILHSSQHSPPSFNVRGSKLLQCFPLCAFSLCGIEVGHGHVLFSSWVLYHWPQTW